MASTKRNIRPADVLRHVFSKLTKKQKENIRYHLRRKTPIVSGQNSRTAWTNGSGGA